ncbi:PLDc_N domain-containing protein [Cryobacterium sp. TMT1-3]|uniref:PLDc_N domain-containing protein n=1 Tax=Cryobacterium luteum TaxID=1424661 RepID=A0A1H8AN90_9MICO|nr:MULTISPECIES: PLD nuclease N-terminal domain-containing protein [Cryobacterium]TFB88582.1 PLDc_N domain-containing protein [Cryobacterium luteum]TFC24610.1 PLDc_N domain-containing protein [Cryobacterium sp. TMT1-3]SEM72210.1 Phospholipase_D-nuclease N-terminal [Cryobacterium luteum]
MPKLLIGLGLALVILTVYTLVDCAVFDRKRIRGLPRWVWIFVIVLVPLIGPLLWLLVGHGRATPTTRSFRSVAPDDDLDFLRGLNSGGSVTTATGENRPFNEKDQQERIRRMEQDLADLDKNDPTPKKGGAAGAADTAGVDPKKKKSEPGDGEQPGRRDA